VDRYRRTSLIDHFLPPGLPLSSFSASRFEEMGNFVELPYTATVGQDQSGTTITMRRDGHVRRAGALSAIPVHLSKTLFIPIGKEQLIVRFTLQNHGQTRLHTHFATEWNFHLLGGGGNEQAYYAICGEKPETGCFDTTGEIPEVREFHIGNTWLQQDMRFVLNKEAKLWHFSIETVTGSEAGFERTHQGSCFTLIWPLTLEAGQAWNVEMVCSGGPAMLQ